MENGAVADNAPPTPSMSEDVANAQIAPLPGAIEKPPQTPQEICAEYGSDFVPPAPLDRAAVALATLDQWPLNAQRVTPERGNCGWYVWGGNGRSGDVGFFQTMHVANLLTRCPQITPFLGLAPGWRVRLSESQREIIAPHALSSPGISRRATPKIANKRRASMQQWVWLSVLLHILAIVLFGDTTGEGSRAGGRIGGPLNVSLAGMIAGTPDAPVALRAETTLSRVERRRAVPRVTPASPPSPAVAVTEDSVAPAEPPPQAAAAPAAIEPATTPAMPPVIAADVATPVTTFVVPLAIPELAPPPAPALAKAAEPVTRLETFVAPKITAPPKVEREVTLPTQLIPSLAAPAPRRIERETAIPIEAPLRLKPFAAPTAEAVATPIELPRIAPLPAPIERAPARAAELLPRLTPMVPAPAIEAARPAEIAPRFAAPVEPAVAPTATSPEAPADRAADPVRSPPSSPAATASPAASSAQPAASRIQPGAEGRSANAEPAGPRDNSAAPLTAPFLPTTPAPATPSPRIDLDAVRRRAREIAREGGSAGPRTLLPLNIKGKEDTRTKEQQAFDKALKRPDCRDAYSGMGLAAVVPLLWDTVSEKGCKW